ncbi:hypothetical protein TRM7557_03919 [Tritonibacter multivorans]|uniref:DUF2059 domain-containing protein n=1 Tax=Tritonibacter multivorans TaxID=928856 RepID=A0A0P1GK58_9RHOB|nr:DUF2059 domain-containing protein [Tritonibacter multivorans]MDA7421437.1 DUF2059 domain-containing protein [Tritonibacter multivorans]CUH82402.1 hypothetical protein TRM7557_03919 [Tritonibacter multivorans]SFC99922.1 hypothetical protein SAMN04488049_105264 [Tritonibacter multivorans]
MPPAAARAEQSAFPDAVDAAPYAQAAIEDFLNITGFDVALDSIAHSAENAPAMIGLDARSFGVTWESIADEVFDPENIRDMAVLMLRETLSPEALDHANSFYASDLGKKLVRAENASHDIVDGDVTLEAGSRIIAQMVQESDPKIEVFRRMTDAISDSDDTLRAVQTVQLRFLNAASDAGIIDLRMDPETLEQALREQEPFLRLSISEGALASNAYTYQGFTIDELNAYVDALEHPLMQEVYSLLNSVQYEIQANRYEALARRMTELAPNSDL